jgi:hypothetical protein
MHGRTPKNGLPIISHFIIRQGAVQDKMLLLIPGARICQL